MLNRPTKIMGHEDLQGFIQHIGTNQIGSVVCNLILQRVPEAATTLGVPFPSETVTEPFQRLIESWVLHAAQGPAYYQAIKITWVHIMLGHYRLGR